MTTPPPKPVKADPRLMALFPHLFSRRGTSTGVVSSRQWRTLNLALDRVRVLGPNWSFVFLVRDLDGLGRNFAMDVLHERAAAEDIPKGARNLHQPTMARIEVRDIWHSNLTGKDGAKSRHSLIAADLGPDLPLGTDADLQAVNTAHSTALIARTFGVMPLNRDFDNDSHNDSGPLYLPAFQAVEGEIWFRPEGTYLTKLRQAFGLSTPDGMIPDADHLVLLPDGFALCGAIELPLEAAPLSAWFKITHRGGLPEGAPIMRLWQTPQITPAPAWNDLLARIAGRIAEVGQDAPGKGPGWLQVVTNSALTQDALFWPCARNRSILLSRPPTPALSVDGGLSVRLSAGPRNVLSIEPEAFSLGTDEHDPQSMVLRVRRGGDGYGAGNNPFGSSATATYSFTRGSEGAEQLTLTGGEADGQDLPIPLAVPVLSNAARLRAGMDFDEPSARDDDRGGGRLWLYTPLSDGWLHWPFPNATTRLMFKLISETARSDDDPSDLLPNHSQDTQTAGMLRFAPPVERRERDWSLSLSDARAVDLRIHLKKISVLEPTEDPHAEDDTQRWVIHSADCTLRDMSMGMKGLLPVTAFAQTETELLPDTGARALRQTALSAVTPDLLSGTEARAWFTLGPDDPRSLRASAVLSPFTVTRQPGTGETSDRPTLSADVRLDLDLKWPWPEDDDAPEKVPFRAPPGSSQPWLWTRHRAVPTLQTMPLTMAGALTNVPSSTRELTPLRFDPADGDRYGGDRRHSLIFRDVLRTDAGHVVLASGGPTGGTRPDAGLTWDSEIGMAVATLPSVTLFPGDPTPRSAAIPDTGWPGLASDGAAVQVDLRYDISLTDEGAALATLPPPPQAPDTAGSENPAPSGGTSDRETALRGAQAFTVLGYNAPGKEGPDNGGTSWMPLWATRARAQALTATGHRRMVKGGKLTSLLLDQTYDTTISLDLRAFPFDQTYQITRYQIGELTFTGDVDQSLQGLPATTDLMGLSGHFARGGASAEITRGTLDTSGTIAASMLDQAGQSQTPEAAIGPRTGLHLKRWTQREPGNETGGLIGTLTSPLTIKAAADWNARFFLRDVVFEKPAGAETWTADLSTAWFDAANGFDAAARALDPLVSRKHAFAWALDQANAPDGHVVLGPLQFEPLALIGAHLAQYELDGVTLRGRVKLALPEHASVGTGKARPRLIAAFENADLIYDNLSGEQSAQSWELKAARLTLPLDDALAPAVAEGTGPAGPAPVLKLTKLVLTSDNTVTVESAVLSMSAGGRTVDLPLPAPKLKEGALWFGTPDDSVAADPVAEGEMRLYGAKVLLPALRRGAAPEPPTATAVLSAVFGVQEDPMSLAAEMVIDARTRAPVTAGTPVTARFGRLSVPLMALNAALDNDALRFDLAADTQDTDLFGGLKVASPATQGAVLAILARNETVQPDSATFEIGPWSFALHLALADGATELTLAHDRLSDPDNVTVAGGIALSNALKAPALGIATDADGRITATEDPDAQPLAHQITATVDGARVAVWSLSPEALSLPARVVHSLSRPLTGPSLNWTTHQIVTLWDAHHFSRARGAVTDADHPPVSLRPAARNAVPGQVSRHVSNSRDAMVCGLSGTQWDGLMEGFPNPGKATLVEFGAHHLLAGPDQSKAAEMDHLPLPGLGAPDPDVQDKLDTILPPMALAGRQLRRFRPLPLPGVSMARRRDMAGLLDRARTMAEQGWTDLAGALIGSDAARPPHLMSRREKQLESNAGDHPLKPSEKPSAKWRKPHRPLFQGQTELSGDTGDWTFADPALPWADSALIRELVLQRFADGNPQTRAIAMTLMPLGWVDSALVARDLVTSNHSSIFTDQAFLRAWQKIGPAAAALVPGPEFSLAGQSGETNNEEPGAATVLRLLVSDRNRGRITQVARKVVPLLELQQERKKLLKWAGSTIARLAPWSMGGLLITARRGLGAERITSAEYVANPRAPAAQGHLHPSGEPVPVDPQGQRMQASPDYQIADVLRDGLLPVSTNAGVLQSEPGALPSEGQADVRLTASTASVGFALARTEQRIVAESPQCDYWIADRQTVAFRGFEEVTDHAARQRLTFALPPETTRLPPAALLPAATGAFAPPARSAIPPAASDRALLPAHLLTRLVNGRSGVLAQHRAGLEEVRHGPLRTPIAAPQGAAHLRLPRPVELGRNDRPRASSYEAAHLALSDAPQALLHGPADTLDQRTLAEAGGLSRAPRSIFATLLQLSDPLHGILPPDWRGEITLEVAGQFGLPPQPDQTWTFSGAYLDINGVLYQPALAKDQPLDTRVTLRHFTAPDKSAATQAIAALPAATAVTLTLLLKTGGLERLTVMTLRRGGTAQPLIDAPAFFRFDDPAYNDVLTGLSRFNRIPLPDSNCDLVIVADRKEILAQDFVSTALFIEPRTAGELPDRKFIPDTGAITHVADSAGNPLHKLDVSLVRRRSGTPGPVVLEKDLGYDAEAGKPFVGTLNLRLFALQASGGTSEPALAEKDRLTLRIAVGDDGLTLPLSFDVTNTPRYPANPSGYAVLRHDAWPGAEPDDPVQKSVSAPLYARGAVPSVIELVDPREMITGIVRRRAVYYWSGFVQMPPRDGDTPRFALLKSSGNGAAWLENRVTEAWPALQSPGEIADSDVPQDEVGP